MPITLYIATTNPGKLRDFAIAAGADTVFEPLPGLATIPAPPEDAPDFEGNAREKALYYSLHGPGRIVLADDSGLEVDALGGAPGVRSARYADDMGYPSDGMSPDARNNACLLDALAAMPSGKRQGRYRCVLVAARDGEVLKVAHGTVEGEILTEARGSSGFGYDPLFFLPDAQQAMAELTPEARLGRSHRGNALRNLLSKLDRSE